MNTITREAYEGDIVSRLRNWRGLHLAHGGELFEEAATEIERLRAIMASESDSPQAVASTPSEASTPGEGTRQTGCTLTDAEREAVDEAVMFYGDVHDLRCQTIAATLRGLLERARHDSPDGCETGQ